MNLYPSSKIELDLRQELIDMFHGTSGEIPKKKKFLLRRMRRDSNNSLIECSCLSSITKEPDTEDECIFCLGEGYYWDEIWIYGYSRINDTVAHLSNKRIAVQPGRVSTYEKIFYFEYDKIITKEDKIIELKLDYDGEISVPYKRNYIYMPETILELRSDFGRIEFIVVYTSENPAVRTR